MLFSIIIPVYNRPDEVRELLESLVRQTYKNFEVLVIEDGSTEKCDKIVQEFENRLDIHYFYKANTGQGFSRNYGFERAKGDYFIVFDSDCLVPEEYLQTVYKHLQANWLDAYGGPDRAADNFTPIQKAISYAMTSLFSTGGIRGNKKAVTQFHPRSFNMGISREVFQKTKGYIITRMGEDIELSIRIQQQGFKVGLIPEAYVYHKRRTNFEQFFKQLHFFGRARINVGRFFPQEVKLAHYFPAVFTLFCALLPLIWFVDVQLAWVQTIILLFYITLLFADAVAKHKHIGISLLSVVAVFVQLWGYGIGFLSEMLKDKTQAMEQNIQNK
ncbi:MAG: glycosyltransferase [Microscillaceae bacterium]|nr:glycosyltransferase [Microscillaceae bacterium]MDW8461769.1 glycosyltransferase [Cytophagales bacterium]